MECKSPSVQSPFEVHSCNLQFSVKLFFFKVFRGIMRVDTKAAASQS